MIHPGVFLHNGVFLLVYFITVVSCVSEIHLTGFRDSAFRHSSLGRLEARFSQLRRSALFSRFCTNLQDFQYSQFARVYSSTRASFLSISLLSYVAFLKFTIPVSGILPLDISVWVDLKPAYLDASQCTVQSIVRYFSRHSIFSSGPSLYLE